MASDDTGSGGTLSALRHGNFRQYFAAQVISNVGTWVQITVENWLVLELTHSALAVAVTNALQFGPLLLLGMYGGAGVLVLVGGAGVFVVVLVAGGRVLVRVLVRAGSVGVLVRAG